MNSVSDLVTPASIPSAKIPIQLAKEPPKVLKMTEDHLKLLEEMRKQLQQDDENLFDMIRDATRKGNYKYDHIAINRAILKKTK